METASITFITGGVRSGKSSFAEKIAIQKAEEMNGFLHYIATGRPTDAEVERRIKRHQKDRRDSGYSWRTWEQTTNIEALASHFKWDDIILIDCLTTMLTNELFAYEEDWSLHKNEIFKRIWAGIQALEENSHHIILVSNEVLFEPIVQSELLMTYSELLGKLHQRMVRVAEKAYVVEAGVPLLMKGGE